MKTPMTQMLELLEELLDSKPTRADRTRFETAIAKAKELIQEEKEQMSKAWEESRVEDMSDIINYVGHEKTFDEYYNQTFNTK